jgi:hypothetical protein
VCGFGTKFETFATTCLLSLTETDNLNAVKVEVKLCCKITNLLLVTKEYWITDSLVLCLYCSLHHCWVNTLSKYHTLWVAASSLVEFLSELALLTHNLLEVSSVCVPVLDRLAGNATLHSGTCNSH